MDAAALLAKASLLDLNQGEIKFLEYKLGMSGAFYRGLFELYFKADRFNKRILLNAWPQEMEAVDRFSNESGYWDELQKKVGL